MNRIRTTEARSHLGERVRIEGWLLSCRKLGGVSFLVIRDGWGTIQAVAEPKMETPGLESAIAVSGRVLENERAPGGLELVELQLEVISAVNETPPITLHRKTMEAGLNAVLDHAPLANRHLERRAIFRAAASAMRAFRETLNAQGFTEIQTPKIVESATESGANVFALDYFGRAAYLAQSPQFYKQMMVGVFERVYEVGPVFRAEPHSTARHINEYVSMDVELGFIESHRTVMRVLEEVIAAILTALGEPAPASPFPELFFTEALELAYQRTGHDHRAEPDLAPEDERAIGAWAREQYGSDFMFVVGYPLSKRPFYTAPDPERPSHSASFDLLYRGTELVTGGQRLHRYEDYQRALASRGMPEAPFASYLEAFRFGMPPHGGFAIGLERLLMQLFGAANVRLTTLFPRDINRLSP